MATQSRLITVAIHTYDKAQALKSLLESEGIDVTLNNVNLESPVVSSGIRVRIYESDLPLALRIIESHEILALPENKTEGRSHTILVPVDFSDYSFEAAKVAADLAFRHKADIELLYAYIDPSIDAGLQLSDSLTFDDTSDFENRREITHSAEKSMSSFTMRLKEGMKSGTIPVVKIMTNVVEGVPEDAIADYCKFNSPLLIVMGTRGHDKKEKDMIGSVTAEVLDSCRNIVLTVPDPADFTKIDDIKNILFLSTMDQEDILAVDALARLMPESNASVTLASLPSKKRRMTAKPEKALLDYLTTNYPTLKFESAGVINDAVEFSHVHGMHRFDLIIVPNKKKNIFSRFFNPGVAHKVLFQTDIPMLVIPV